MIIDINGVQEDYSLTKYLDFKLNQIHKNNDGSGKYDNYLRLYYFNEDAIIDDGEDADKKEWGVLRLQKK